MKLAPALPVWPLAGLLLLLVFVSVGQPAWAQQGDFQVFFGRPAQGETFYSGASSLLYSLPVSGWLSGEGVDFSRVSVRLEVYAGQNLVGSASENALADGTFGFHATANPENSDIAVPAEVAVLGCADLCHFSGDFDLPAGSPGEYTLRLSAASPDGRTASAERQIKIDHSGFATIPVRVVDGDDPDHPLEGIVVKGSTRLYLWRARNSTSTSDGEGNALLQVESLSLSSTHYEISVDPIVIDGVLYTSQERASVTLKPAARSAAPVTLRVYAHRGQVRGHLTQETARLTSPITVWLIDPQEGSSRKMDTAAGGEFEFMDLPLDDYLLAADADRLAVSGLSSPAMEIDLTRSMTTTLGLPVRPLEGGVLRGRLKDEKSSSLPFAWVTLEETKIAQPSLPSSGDFTLLQAPEGSFTLIASAPGHYSQAQVFRASEGEPVEIQLKRRPDTVSLAWGSGEVILPAESEASVQGQLIALERGWLWGSGVDAQPLRIQASGVEIRMERASFALEDAPGQPAWLYVLEGQAELRAPGVQGAVHVKAGEMVHLTNPNGLVPVPLDPVVIAALRQPGAAPVLDIWEPTLGAQVRDRLARIGIGTAQMVTFITSILVFIALVLVPLGAVYWMIRRKTRTGDLTGGY